MIKIDLTTSEWDRIKRKNTILNSVTMIVILGGCAALIACLVMTFKRKFFFEGLTLYVVGLLFSLISKCLTRMNAPEGGSGKKINDVSKYFLAESCSDGTVYNITTAINMSRKPAEKAFMKLMLTEVYTFRGQFDDALRTIYSIEPPFIREHPETALLYYADLISIYHKLRDHESVRNAYNDAVMYINAVGTRNLVLYRAACSIQADYLHACGDLSGAAELHMRELLYIRQAYRMQMEKQGGKILIGSSLLDIAELYFDMKDYGSAERYCLEAQELLAEFPYLNERADTLMGRIVMETM